MFVYEKLADIPQILYWVPYTYITENFRFSVWFSVFKSLKTKFFGYYDRIWEVHEYWNLIFKYYSLVCFFKNKAYTWLSRNNYNNLNFSTLQKYLTYNRQDKYMTFEGFILSDLDKPKNLKNDLFWAYCISGITHFFLKYCKLIK